MSDAPDSTTPQRPIGSSALKRATSLARVVVRRSLESGRKLRRMSSMGRATGATQRMVQRAERSNAAITGRGIGSLTPEMAANFADRVLQRQQPGAQGVLRRALQPADGDADAIQRLEMPMVGEGAGVPVAGDASSDDGGMSSSPTVSASEMLARINSAGTTNVFRSAAESSPIPPGTTPDAAKALVAQRAAQNRSAVQRTTAEPLAAPEKIREAREQSPRPSPALVRRYSRVEERTQLQRALLGDPAPSTPAPDQPAAQPERRVQRAPASAPDAVARSSTQGDGVTQPPAPPTTSPAAPQTTTQQPVIRRVPRATRSYVTPGAAIEPPIARQVAETPAPPQVQRASEAVDATSPVELESSRFKTPSVDVQRSPALAMPTRPDSQPAPDAPIARMNETATQPEVQSAETNISQPVVRREVAASGDVPAPARPAQTQPAEPLPVAAPPPPIQRSPQPPASTPEAASATAPTRGPAPSRAAIRRAVAANTPASASPAPVQRAPDVPKPSSTAPVTAAKPATPAVQRVVQAAPEAQPATTEAASPVAPQPTPVIQRAADPASQSPPDPGASTPVEPKTEVDMPVLRRVPASPSPTDVAVPSDDAPPAPVDAPIARKTDAPAVTPQPRAQPAEAARAQTQPEPVIRRSPAVAPAPGNDAPAVASSPAQPVVMRQTASETPDPIDPQARIAIPPIAQVQRSPTVTPDAPESLPVRRIPMGQRATPEQRAMDEMPVDPEVPPPSAPQVVAQPVRVQRAPASLAVTTPVAEPARVIRRRATAATTLARKALPVLQMPLTQRAAMQAQVEGVEAAPTAPIRRSQGTGRPVNPFEVADATTRNLPVLREVPRMAVARAGSTTATEPERTTTRQATPAAQRSAAPAVQRAAAKPTQIQRAQTDGPAQPSEGNTGGDGAIGDDQPAQAADLDALARQLLPHIKRMVRHERERMFGR